MKSREYQKLYWAWSGGDVYFCIDIFHTSYDLFLDCDSLFESFQHCINVWVLFIALNKYTFRCGCEWKTNFNISGYLDTGGWRFHMIWVCGSVWWCQQMLEQMLVLHFPNAFLSIIMFVIDLYLDWNKRQTVSNRVWRVRVWHLVLSGQ